MCCARKSAPMKIGKTAEDDEFVWYNHTKYRGVTTRIESCVCTLLLLLPVRCSLNVVSAELWMWWWREAMVNEECDANDVRAEWGSEHEPHDGLNVYKCLPLAAEFSLSWSFQAKTSYIDIWALLRYDWYWAVLKRKDSDFESEKCMCFKTDRSFYFLHCGKIARNYQNSENRLIYGHTHTHAHAFPHPHSLTHVKCIHCIFNCSTVNRLLDNRW